MTLKTQYPEEEHKKVTDIKSVSPATGQMILPGKAFKAWQHARDSAD